MSVSASAALPILSGVNAEYIANLYKEYLKTPSSVDVSWRDFFADLRDNEAALLRELSGASWTPKDYKKPSAPFGVVAAEDVVKSSKPANQDVAKPVGGPAVAPVASTSAPSPSALKDSMQALLLVKAYRGFGHFAADLDPLALQPKQRVAELDPAFYGFGEGDLDRPVYLGGVLGVESATIHQLIEVLSAIYCGKVGVEYEHILSAQERDWIRERVEGSFNRSSFLPEQKRTMFKHLVAAQGIEDFLHTKYVGAKRFGLDGSESYIAGLEELIRHGVELGVREVVMGMAHRGRLNTLTNVLRKPFTELFAEFNGISSKPEGTPGTGDVKYHLGCWVDREYEGHSVHMSLAQNPSHLEVVDAVATGKARARQFLRHDANRTEVLPVLVHGDAAFAGQGLVAETLMMSELDGYRVGGTVHIIINNQIGFTTNPKCSRSGPYSSDISKMIGVPVFHVNGDDVEAVAHVARLAIEYRQQFGRDVVIDLITYRKSGHNEGDEPMFTQPLMYKNIKTHESVRTYYGRKLVEEGVMTAAEEQAEIDSYMAMLEVAYEDIKNFRPNRAPWLYAEWEGLKPAHGENRRGETGLDPEFFNKLGEKLVELPADFSLNSKIARQFEAKKEMFKSGTGFDWATGEALAFGALLVEGYPVRLSGQDCERGTFSHRHAVVVDQNTESKYTPLNNIQPNQAKLEVLNSPLSEAAVLGFEYGYSWATPNSLVIWEAQFGDFVNGAQVIIDQYIAAAETKWLRMSGLTLLLPHGYEGQGPEHSSAHLERFLQGCAEDNWQICNITTPANYFHALRRQMVRDFRKPLVIMSPKSLLRHKLAVSKTEDFIGDSVFHRILPDGAKAKLAKAKDIKRVVLCSGKVYYDLFEEREKRGIDTVVLLRIEQFYPFPSKVLAEELAEYQNAEIVWCQEEPKNHGAWSFVDPLIEEVLAEVKTKSTRPKYIGRPAASSPATGHLRRHNAEQAQLLDDVLTV
jgi:2-oxoglutarate dehydrogenase E1 component